MYKNIIIVIAMAVVISAGQAGAQHAGDLWIGVDADGRLTLDVIHGYDPANNVRTLSPVNGPFFWGWTSSDPGFDHLTASYPALGLVPMDSQAEIWLEVVDIDPGFYVEIPPSYSSWLGSPGDKTFLGYGSTLHKHLVWHIDTNDPAYDPNQCAWRITLALTDARAGSGHLPSETFILTFSSHDLIPADFDCDLDVDLDDLAVLESCRTAPGIALSDADCWQADLDGDSDVDQADFAIYQKCYSGQNVTGQVDCNP